MNLQIAVSASIPAYLDEDVKLVGRWLKSSRANLRFDKKTEPMSKFTHVIESMEKLLSIFPKDRQKIAKIEAALERGEPAWPIFVDAKDSFVMEGRHRLVAQSRHGLKKVVTYRCSVDIKT